MSLTTYRRKRRFDRTPEPAGFRRAERGETFTVQRHHASRLHYDFRLELDGVLKSWAVPKGPCLDPSARRLAVEVEDHPVEYGSFEGEIPKGQYGGGTVVLWDRGTWTPLGDPRAGLRKGHLRFSLSGSKLSGRWDLVLLRGRAAEEGKRNWLLIKVDDQAARPLSRYDVTEARPESVSAPASRRRRRVWQSNRAPAKSRRPAARRPAAPRLLPGSLTGAVKAPLPERLEPQLCTLVDAAPPGEEWVHEIKLDGYRIVARLDGGEARLSTRRGNDWTADFPAIASALADLRARQAVLDGEIVVLDEKGVSSFQALQNALSESGRGALLYYVFDLLYLDGWDLRGAPLAERKALLEKLLARAPAGLRYCEHVAGGGPAFLARACELALEGVVSKRADAPYVGARTKSWLKSKCLRRQELVVCGYTEPKGSRSGFGALVLGVREHGKLRYAGKVGTGFNERALGDLKTKLAGLRRDTPPFDGELPSAYARGVTWTTPSLVAEVAFGEWTKDGILRHPRYLGLREDKPASEVRREEPAPAVAGVVLSNPGRVLYPEQAVTKLELARYYEAAAELALPHLRRRALAVVRCPAGRQKHCFFQKHLGEDAPPSLHGVEIVEGGTPRRYFYVDGLDGIVSLVQLGALELHPWGSRVDGLETPDVMTFDLDPGPGVEWKRLREAALELRSRLGTLGLVSFLKTTGGKGLHVVVPLVPSADWERVKSFSKAFVEVMEREAPELYVTKMTKSIRGGKIFLDYLRNGRGATAVGAYSTRAREGATVAAPLAWDELGSKPLGGFFTVRTMPGRLKSLGADPWKGFFDLPQRLKP